MLNHLSTVSGPFGSPIDVRQAGHVRADVVAALVDRERAVRSAWCRCPTTVQSRANMLSPSGSSHDEVRGEAVADVVVARTVPRRRSRARSAETRSTPASSAAPTSCPSSRRACRTRRRRSRARSASRGRGRRPCTRTCRSAPATRRTRSSDTAAHPSALLPAALGSG